MKYYIVKHAVYLHGVYGPYDTKEEALVAFKEAYDAVRSPNDDFDGHHTYTLVHGLVAPIGQDSDVDTDGEIIQHKPKRVRYTPLGQKL